MRTREELLISLALEQTMMEFMDNITGCERAGIPLTVEDCEFIISKTEDERKSLYIAGIARKAFRASVADQEVDQAMAQEIAAGNLNPYLAVNYPTLRKALYLSDIDRIRIEIHEALKHKYPWGLQK